VAGAVGPTNKTLSVSPSVERPDFRNISKMIDPFYYVFVLFQDMCRSWKVLNIWLISLKVLGGIKKFYI